MGFIKDDEAFFVIDVVVDHRTDSIVNDVGVVADHYVGLLDHLSSDEVGT